MFRPLLTVEFNLFAPRSASEPVADSHYGGSASLDRAQEPVAIGVQNDRQHDDRPDDDRLEIVADAEQLQPGAENLKNTGPDEAADDRALAAAEAGAADDDCRDRIELVANAGDRAADVQPQQIDDGCGAGGQSADGERRDLVVSRRVAGEPHRFLIRADGEYETAKHGETEDEPADQDHPDRDQEYRRQHAPDDHISEIDEGLRQAGDRRIVAQHARCAAGDVEHPEGDDEGRELPLLAHPPVDRAAGGAGPHAAEDGERDRESGRQALVRHDQRADDRAQREDRADRKVDAAGQDHKRHARSQYRIDCDLYKDLQEVFRAGEIWRGHTEE
jgi:hypothetical protein